MAAHFTMKRKRPATELSADQREAFRIFSESKHLAVFGKPGTGKTALRDAFAARYPCVLLGPTGTSVQNVFGAYTIARFLGATVATAGDPGALARNMRLPFDVRDRVLVIDEIAMVSAFDFVALDAGLKRTLRSDAPFGGLRVVLLGDLYQLRPPTQSAVTFFFETAAYSGLERAGLQIHNLTTQHRQTGPENAAFLPFLDEARACKLGTASHDLLLNRLNKKAFAADALHLFARNADASRHNAHMLKAMDGTERTVCGFKCKRGAKVVLTRNVYKNRKLLYTNGTFGVIENVKAQSVTVRIAHEIHEVKPFANALPIALAWATTIHKVQGKTLRNVVVHGDNIFEAGQAYVGVSRASSLAGLSTRNLHPDDFELPYSAKLRTFAADNGVL